MTEPTETPVETPRDRHAPAVRVLPGVPDVRRHRDRRGDRGGAGDVQPHAAGRPPRAGGRPAAVRPHRPAAVVGTAADDARTGAGDAGAGVVLAGVRRQALGTVAVGPSG